MHVEIVQHVSFEGPGAVAIWADVGGHSLHCTGLYHGDRLPDNEHVDLAVIMGGPMSVHDETRFPWLRDEKAWIGERLNARIPTVGICLGSQLIAEQLGANVAAGEYPEVGWYPVERCTNESTVFCDFPDWLPVLHWHRDCHGLPPGAHRTASSAVTPVQAFDYEGYAIGLQFHLEVGEKEIEKLCGAAVEETMQEGRYVQTVHEIREGLHHAPKSHKVLYDLLNRLTADRVSRG